MSPSNSPRKFVPAPIEQTTKSSQQSDAQTDAKPKPRRFAPEPIEETTKSSKDASQQAKQEEKPKPRRFAPQLVEDTTKSTKDAAQKPAEQEGKPKPRRFAPQLVEDTTKSTKDTPPKPAEQDKKAKPRRFAPQVVEETHKDSKEKEVPKEKAHVKFKPELVSTTHGTNKKGQSEETNDKSEQKGPRKFTPILLDTARRSRRAGNPDSPFTDSHKTEYAYHVHHREHWERITKEQPATQKPHADDVASDSDNAMSIDADQPSPLTRQAAPLDGSAPKRPSCLAPARTHSFRMPELDTIESSESEPDSNPSPTSSSPGLGGSPITASDVSYELFKHATRKRESVDENFTHYLLDLEREKQRKRLEEQALAAFPNPDFGYEPPDHYINNDDDSDEMEYEDRVVTFDFEEEDAMDIDKPRRDSTATMTWEQIEAQKHAEQAQQERNANKVTAKPSQSPWWKPPDVGDAADDELKSMRERARPPMLGSDIVFPRCPSPDPARFDVTQGSAALRNQMCYLTAAAEDEKKRSGEEGGLWHALGAAKRVSTAKSPVKSPITAAASPTSAKGLWGGFCVDDGESKQKTLGLVPPAGPTGLVTPKNEPANPFHLAHNEARPIGMHTPPTTPIGLDDSDLGHLDAVLVTEKQLDTVMDDEYPDSFITQVYNYLSLGYPSLARPFDEELSKISRIPMIDLRQDDQKAKATPRGYIRLGPDFEGGGGEGMTEDSCMRWQALKRYIREWARQEKNMVPTDGVFGNWGTGARRGSWAI